jgi:SAM-dependent methyltransferase
MSNASPATADRDFGGSIPEVYERHLVPLIFAPYAMDLACRIAGQQPQRVLEIAAGTGVVTRQLAQMLTGTIVATDFNQPMLEQAAAIGTTRPVEFKQADAQALPFEAESFDAVVCQFGVMFFPDKQRAFAEVNRVLRPGGYFIFNVWDRIEDNDFAHIVSDAVAALFPDDPPRFLARTPHGYHDQRAISGDLSRGGFELSPDIVTVTAQSVASSARIPALGFCQGTPLRNEIEARAPERLGEATSRAELAIARRFGTGSILGKIQAHVIIVKK